VFLGFFKYIGYLAFPIQMTYRYPALARFMAGHWATEAVHVVPIFGERGALLEHKIFNLFYNWPLTIRRRMRKRSEIRESMAPRYWHIFVCMLIGTGIFMLIDWQYLETEGSLPTLQTIWSFAIIVSLLIGMVVTLGAGGAALLKRIAGGALCGVAVGLLSAILSGLLVGDPPIESSAVIISGVWRAFVFTIMAVLGVLLTEIKMPESRD
jgi:hypothetical protein